MFIKQVCLLATPTKIGGVDRGIFYLNGKVKELGIMRFDEKGLNSRVVEIFDILPNSQREIAVLTFPQAGCFYPISMSLQCLN